MDYFSVWPSIVCMATFYGVAATPLLRAADTPPNDISKRNSTLDGLRGFLALAVVIHHGAVYHGFQATGIWDVPPSNLYTGLGEAGVSMFFMVTGYLFWRKLLTEEGRGGVDWIALAVGRVFRIVPVFMLAIAPTLIIVGFLTHWTLTEPIGIFTRKLIKTASLGIFPVQQVNGFKQTSTILAGVTWSLQYEWAFYTALPILGFILRLRHRIPSLERTMPWLLPAAIFTGCLVAVSVLDKSRPIVCCALFCAGMFAAACGPVRIGADWLRSIIVLALVTTALIAFPSSMRPGAVILLTAAFLLIASGCTVFGVLTSRPAIRLGDISYGIYLLQGLTLAAVYWPAPLAILAQSGAAAHWLLFLLATLSLIGIATVAHVYVERPGIKAGRSVVAHLRKQPRGEQRIRHSSDSFVELDQRDA